MCIDSIHYICKNKSMKKILFAAIILTSISCNKKGNFINTREFNVIKQIRDSAEFRWLDKRGPAPLKPSH